jgi:hypothetical protein
VDGRHSDPPRGTVDALYRTMEKKMKLYTKLAVAAVWSLIALPIQGQASLGGPDEDAGAHATQLYAILHRYGVPAERTLRIWIHPDAEALLPGVQDPAQRPRLDPYVLERLGTLERTLDGIRLVDDAEALFDCSQGAQRRMPSSGCAVRENGVIVSFGVFRQSGNDVASTVSLIRSVGGTSTIATCETRFRWSPDRGDWEMMLQQMECTETGVLSTI